MEISYKGKKTKEEIIERSKSTSFDKRLGNASMLFFCDNFKGLSCLLANGLKGKIDLIYIDPPYNTRQSFCISEDRKSTISRTKDGEVAYSDNLPIEEYLEFIRERLVLMYELLSEEGSLYFHIDNKIGHYCKIILDEIFGKECFKNDIARIKSNPKNFSRTAYGNEKDTVLFYAKNPRKNIWNNVAQPLTQDEIEKNFPKKDEKGFYTTIPLHAPGETANGVTGGCWRGMSPPKGRHWRTDPKEFEKLDAEGLIEWSSNGNPRIKKYASEHKGKKIQDIWNFKDPQYPNYPTQKNFDMLCQIVMQSSNSESIVLDCFSGGGTTLAAAEKCGRKWIGMDNSHEAIKATKTLLKNIGYDEYIID